MAAQRAGAFDLTASETREATTVEGCLRWPRTKGSRALGSSGTIATTRPGPPGREEEALVTTSDRHRFYGMSFASVYPHYVAKAEKKGRTKREVDAVIRWLTGYPQRKLRAQLKKEVDFETFFAEAPELNPRRELITGVVCGVRVEEVEQPLMQEIRRLDKLVDELARGKSMEKVLRE